jgi:hypothetical protein
MLDVALGARPRLPLREGRYPMAAKFMWRSFEDGVVRRAPSHDEIERLRRQLPGTEIEVHVEPERRLSDLTYGDSYSYELAAIFLGGRDEADLLQRYDACRRGMTIELEPL